MRAFRLAVFTVAGLIASAERPMALEYVVTDCNAARNELRQLALDMLVSQQLNDGRADAIRQQMLSLQAALNNTCRSQSGSSASTGTVETLPEPRPPGPSNLGGSSPGPSFPPAVGGPRVPAVPVPPPVIPATGGGTGGGGLGGGGNPCPSGTGTISCSSDNGNSFSSGQCIPAGSAAGSAAGICAGLQGNCSCTWGGQPIGGTSASNDPGTQNHTPRPYVAPPLRQAIPRRVVPVPPVGLQAAVIPIDPRHRVRPRWQPWNQYGRRHINVVTAGRHNAAPAAAGYRHRARWQRVVTVNRHIRSRLGNGPRRRH